MQNKYDEKSKIVDAKYTLGTGNLLIDALPEPFVSLSEVNDFYEKGINYNRKNVLKMSKGERIMQIRDLKFLRLPLPFHKDAEDRLFNSLYESYKNRELGKFVGEYKLKGSVASCSNEGFAMLGYSGCGKSSTLKILTSRYKTIKHNLDGDIFIQIPILVVSCVENSNFSVLYQSIGKALDEILDTDIYCDIIRREKTLGGKMQRIEDFIEKFAIGALILDEIQNIDFSKNKENSYEGLLTISNDTKVAICVVGTEDAYSKLFSNLRTARRAGLLIPASSYCGNKDIYDDLLENIFEYQWTNKRVNCSEEIKKTFYKCTKGIIALTATLYQALQMACVENDISITPDLIEMTAKEYLYNMDNITDDMNDPYIQKQIEDIDAKARKLLDKRIKESKQDEKEFLDTKKANDINKLASEIHNFVSSYSVKEIESVLINLSKNYTGDKLKAEAIKVLNKAKKHKSLDNEILFSSLQKSFDKQGEASL